MPASRNPLRLAEFLCARISHDLGGMIGTLGGALEIAEDPAVAAEALALANQSSGELRLRLELLRASWGPATAPLDLPRLRSLADGVPHAGRFSLNLAGVPRQTVFAPAFARVLLNLLMLAGEALHGGGEIALTGNATDLAVALAGPNAAWPSGLAGCLASDTAAWRALRDPRSLQMPLTALLARALGLRLTLLLAGRPGRVPPLRLQEV